MELMSLATSLGLCLTTPSGDWAILRDFRVYVDYNNLVGKVEDSVTITEIREFC